jgi:serine/threonine protein kinase/tetratricopeptide (TPR) repeat protein
VTDPLGRIRTAIAERYEIIREIGQGAFAVVYLARDLRHDRTVAVKVLNTDTGSENSELRFTREIHLLAKLQHPNILPLIDSGHVGATLYYVTPYVSGESLRDRLVRERQLSIRSAVSIARETADALDCAHRDGIVHRDVKPENILLSAGHAIVADFGIAHAIDVAGVRHLTRTGFGSPGTPTYMSPEQLIGERQTDARSDIYSLGCVLYEMLTGKPPFAGKELVKRVTEGAPSPRSIRKDVPSALESVVLKSLAREPNERYQTAAEFAEALQEGATPAPRSRKQLLTVASAIVLVLVVSSGVYWSRKQTPTPKSGQSLATVAVLPFSNTDRATDEEYFSDGMTDELAQALSRLPGVQVAARTSSYAFKGKAAPVQQIGQILNVSAIVEGTVRRAGDRLRVTAALTNVADGLVRWSGAYESRGEDVFQVQDSLTQAIVGAIAPALQGKQASTVASTSRGTESADAYDLYLRGRYFLAKRGATNLDRAVVYFKEAIAKDPGFARAHSGLALTYLVLPSYAARRPDSVVKLAIQSATRAIAIDSTLADAQMAMGGALASEFKLAQARHYLETAIGLEPGNAPAHFWYGIMFRLAGDVDGDLRELGRAAELDPLSPVTRSNLAYAYYATGRMSEAIEQARRVLEIDSTAYPAAYFYLGLPYLFSGKPDGALAAFASAYRLNPEGTGSRGLFTLGLAATGQWRDAERVRADIARRPRAVLDMVFADLAFGDWDGALSLLEGLQKDGYLGAMNISVGCSPLFSPLKSNARYIALIKKLGIHACRPVARWPIGKPVR